MLKIWGRSNSINVQKVMWTVGELGLKYERIDAGGAFGRNRDPEYLALNPNGLVPTLEDDGEVVWESNTIVRYLASRYGDETLWPAEPARRADSERWMDWQLGTLQGAIGPMFMGLIRTPPEQRDMAAIEASRANFAELMKILDAHLASRLFVGGPVFTVGDIPIGCIVHRWYALPIQRPKYLNLEAYYARLKQRPAFVKHVVDIPVT